MAAFDGAASGAGMGAAFGGPWGALAGAGIGALGGAIMGNQQRQQQQQYNQAQAEVTRYSPWTGMRGQVSPVTGSPLGGAMQGALSGGIFGAGLSRQAGAPTTDVNNVKDTGSALGGSTMTADLGQMGQNANKWASMPSFYDSQKPAGGGGYTLGMNFSK